MLLLLDCGERVRDMLMSKGGMGIKRMNKNVERVLLGAITLACDIAKTNYEVVGERCVREWVKEGRWKGEKTEGKEKENKNECQDDVLCSRLDPCVAAFF